MAGVAVNYIINGTQGTTFTDANGSYSITVPRGAQVMIIPSVIPGYTAGPPEFVIPSVTTDVQNYDFSYTTLPASIVLNRATSVLPSYSSPPNAWPLHGSIQPNLFMIDKILITLPPSPISVRWAFGVRDVGYFTSGGGFDITDTYAQGLPVQINDSYTVYALFSDSFGVASILIDNMRVGSASLPYLLLDFPTALALEPSVPGIGLYTLNFMQGGGAKLSLSYELYESVNMTGRTWEPLGIADPSYPFPIIEAFTGGLFGNGNAISDLTIGRGGTVFNQGFFRALSDGAIIQNLMLTNCNVFSQSASAGLAAIANVLSGGVILIEDVFFSGYVSTLSYAGGIIAMCYENNGSIIVRGCTVDGYIENQSTGGGIVGYSRVSGTGASWIIQDCRTSGNVLTFSDTASGIIASCNVLLGSSLTITGCVNAMTVSNNSNRAAGILATAYATGASSVIISSCFNSGSITAGCDAGAMCGSYSSSGGSTSTMRIENCYNIADININRPALSYTPGAGGIAGKVFGVGYILNCYSLGDVTCYEETDFGQITVGGISSNYGDIQNCVALCQQVSVVQGQVARISATSANTLLSLLNNNLAYEGMQVLINYSYDQKDPLDTGSSGTDGISASLATLTQQSTYETTLGWDFTDVWLFGNGAYNLPILRSIPANLQPTSALV